MMMGSSRGAFLYGLLFVVGSLMLVQLGGCPGETLQRPPADPGLSPVRNPRVHYDHLDRLIEHEPRARDFLNPVRRAVRRHRDRHPVDPLLVLALIKRESSFDTLTISRMGAGGPLQLMPSTARHLGMTPVHETDNLKQGLQWHRRARRSLTRAVGMMKEERFLPMRRHLESWRNLRSRSREALADYREDLRSRVEGRPENQLREVDVRFVTERAVDGGVQYLARMLDRRDGDVREALAAYNAGPTSVRKYRGIPPFDETVRYQNRVVNTYREYRRRMARSGSGSGDTRSATQRPNGEE